MANYSGKITVIESNVKKIDHAERVATQKRDETAYRCAEAKRKEREAAHKARKKKDTKKIKDMGEVLKRNREREHGQA